MTPRRYPPRIKVLGFPRKMMKGFTKEDWELLIANTVATIITFGTLTYVLSPRWGAINDSAKFCAETISEIAYRIRQKFPQHEYAGLNNDTANQVNVFPSWMNKNNHAPGQEITYSSDNRRVIVAPAGQANQHFTITYQNVERGICVPFVQRLVNSFERVSVDGILVKDTFGDLTVNPDPNNIVHACSRYGEADVVVETT